MEQEQRIEMSEEIRRLRGTGEPEKAQKIKAALDDGRYFMGLIEVKGDTPTQPKKVAKKDAWIKFALAVSDIDRDIISSATKSDLIAMLKANGLLASE